MMNYSSLLTTHKARVSSKTYLAAGFELQRHIHKPPSRKGFTIVNSLSSDSGFTGRVAMGRELDNGARDPFLQPQKSWTVVGFTEKARCLRILFEFRGRQRVTRLDMNSKDERDAWRS